MKINYPIQYAAMPIIEQIGWNHGINELEEEYDIVCYLVSKCYLLHDSIKYMEDGSSRKEYEVVFPYQIGLSRNWERTEPSFNLYSGCCINSKLVDCVFDSYEEACQYVNEKNEVLRKKSKFSVPYSKNFAEKTQEVEKVFDDRLARYKLLEQQILNYTEDLEVGRRKKLDSVVEVKNKKSQILFCNLYEFIRVYNNVKFVVYTIKPCQYKELIRFTNGESSNDLSSIVDHAECLLTNEKHSLMRVINPDDAVVYYLDEDRFLHPNATVEKIAPEEFEKIKESAMILYTTETLDDLIESYRTYESIDLSKLSGPVLKKVKK